MKPQGAPQDPRERWCRLVLRALAASFALVGTIFFVAPDGTVRVMNAVGAALGDFAAAPPSALRFWLSLGTGYMVLVTALAWVAQRDLRRHRVLVALLALGKATSALTCLGFYIFTLDAFIYLANFLVDGTIAVTALAIWGIIPSVGVSRGLDAAAAGGPGDRTAARSAASILEAMVPRGGPFAEGAHDIVDAGALESFLAGAAPGAVGALRLLLRLVDVSPFFLPPLRLRRFSALPLAERVEILEAWERSRLVPRRQAMHALKMLVLTHVYSRPEIAARVGYPHPLERVPRNAEDAA
jgi:hypothetical protein